MSEIQKPTPLHHLRTDLTIWFPERKEFIAGALAAVLAGEYVLARAIVQAFGGSDFGRLLTRSAPPRSSSAPSR
jgi:hypothetical protein